MDFKTFKEEVKENVRAHLPKEGMPIQHLKEMVAEVNGSFVEDADRLTDEVYHFDTKDRVFEKVDKFVARQKENSQKHVAEKGTEGI